MIDFFKTNYKTAVPGVAWVLCLIVCLVLLSIKRMTSSDFTVVMTLISSICGPAIGIGAKDADK